MLRRLSERQRGIVLTSLRELSFFVSPHASIEEGIKNISFNLHYLLFQIKPDLSINCV